MSHTRTRPAAIIACACALAMLVIGAPAGAAPGETPAAPGQQVTVDVTQASPSITPDGALRADVAVTTTAPAEYLEVRLRLYNPAGRLVYQKTEVRSEVEAGRHVVGYDHDLGPLGLAPGRYPIEVRILATGSAPTSVASRLLIVPTDASPVRVALIAHVSGTPSFGVDGRFTRDPASDTRVRDDLMFLSDLSADRRAPFSLAIAPVLVEQMARIADGYELTDGTVVDDAAETPGRYARAIADLRAAVATGTIDLLDVPYALPDPAGIAQLEASADLARHWAATDAVNATVLGRDIRSDSAFVGERPDRTSITAADERAARVIVVAPDALVAEDSTATPGCYRTADADACIVAFDGEASSSAALGSEVFYDTLYERLGSPEPVVIYLQLGPQGPDRAIEVQNVLDWVARASWLEMAPLSETAGADGRAASLAPLPASAAPPLYWDSVAEGRTAAAAYASAVGEADPDAVALASAVLMAESGLWAGTDGTWAEALQGLALADDVRESVAETLSGISIDARDVTLSASRGDVPLALTNNTGKRLTLTLVAWSDRITLNRPETEISVQPAQNFVTVPVELGAIIAGDLWVTVKAGDIIVAETSVRVRASHLDRLATVGMVVVVLVALLLFIRRRVRAAIADTIAPGTDADDGPTAQ